jgi:nucleotide-binding universal stress UspA family protein
MKLQVLLPVHTYPDGNTENIVLHSSTIARFLDADVHALVLDVDFPGVSSALGDMIMDVPELIAGVKAKSRERGSALLHALESEFGPRAIKLRTTRIECFPGEAGDVVTGFARYHDLVVAGIRSSDATSQATAEATIFGSGRPTLLVPEEASVATFEHVMIAWDGSRVAARAVSDARDFLRLAKTVTIASVPDEKTLPEADPGARLAEYLSHHEIQALVAQIRGLGRPVAQALQEHAWEIGASMIVMGGFGHSRMRDFVLGGATSGILKDLRLPVLMSH